MTEVASTQERVIRRLLDASDLAIDPENVNLTTSLRDDLEISSLQALTLIMDLEEDFGIEVEDDEFEDLKTVGDVVAVLESKK